MKQRIFSIMDMSRKKAGIEILCCALMLTLGTGVAFAANGASAEAEGSQKEVPYAYSFRPDPEIYSQYSPYGISISDDGEKLFYNGQRVRLFADEHSDAEAFFLDEAGTIDLSVLRGTAGGITGIESIPEQKAQEYRSAFFAGDTIPNAGAKETVQETVQETAQENVKGTAQDTAGKNKLDLYAAYGISLSADGEVMYYNGQRVKVLVDQLPDGSFETFWTDQAGKASLWVVRNGDGQIASIRHITEEQAQKYVALLGEYEQTGLDGVEKRVEAKMGVLFPENGLEQ